MRFRVAVLLLGCCGLLAGCDPERNTRPIVMRAKPPLIERQFCMALRDAERQPQDSMVIRGMAVHGTPDVFRVTCDGQEHELLFALAPAEDDDFGMKDFRKQWSKKTGKNAECRRCPKYDIEAKFVGMVKKDESGRVVFVAQTADEVKRKRIGR